MLLFFLAITLFYFTLVRNLLEAKYYESKSYGGQTTMGVQILWGPNTMVLQYYELKIILNIGRGISKKSKY